VVARGEVCWVVEPASGRRPHLVLTRETAVSLLNVLIAVPATRTIRGAPTEVFLDEDDGMPGACVLSVDNIRGIPKELFRERITKLSSERMSDVCRALAIATGCD
jgi:mRNA interferase MazF